MGKPDYTSTGGGLRLKGSSKPSGIEKKKKKDKKKLSTIPAETTTSSVVHRIEDAEVSADEHDAGLEDEGSNEKSVVLGDLQEDGKSGSGPAARDVPDTARATLLSVQKTEAERRHEEMRRRRLDERLKREGIKTHKERVEELNKYLSGLSEHHDMPRIGPG